MARELEGFSRHSGPPLWLWGLILLPRIFVLALALRHPTYIATGDSVGYLNLASHLRTEHQFATDLTGSKHPEISRLPGYPAFLSLFPGTTRGDYRGILLAQGILAVFSLWIVWHWLRELDGLRGASIGVSLLAVDPITLFHLPQMMAETLFYLILTLAAWLSWRSLSRPALSWPALGGFCWGLSAMIKPVSLFLPLLLSFLYVKNPRRLFLFLAMAYALPLLWIGRNQHVAGYRGFSAQAGVDLLRYPAGTAEALRTGRPWAAVELELRQRVDEHHPSGYTSQAQRSQAYFHEAVTILARHPVLVARLCLEGSLRILFGAGLEMLVDLLSLSRDDAGGNKRPAKITGAGTLGLLRAYPPLIVLELGTLAMLLFLYAAFITGVRRLILLGRTPEALFLTVGVVYFLMISNHQGYYRFRIPMMPFLAAGLAANFCQEKRPSTT